MYSKNYLIHVVRGLFNLCVKRASPIWGTPLIIYLSLAIPNSFGFVPDLNMRISGFILQVLFIGIILIDLYKLSQEEEFNIPNMKNRIKKWFKDFKEVFKKSATMDDVNAKAESSFHGKMIADFNLYEDDVEENLKLLESEIKSLKERTDKEFERISSKLQALESKINQEVEKREEEIKKFKGFYKRITTSGFIPEIVGLTWLVFGLLFSIFPNGLSFILNWL